MNDTPFTPFTPLPTIESPPLAPGAPKTTKRQKKTVPAATTAATPAPAKPARKRKPAAAKAKQPKFELQTILSVASTLKEDDMPLFEKMLGQLQEAGKPTRERVLAAVGKVFA